MHLQWSTRACTCYLSFVYVNTTNKTNLVDRKELYEEFYSAYFFTYFLTWHQKVVYLILKWGPWPRLNPPVLALRSLRRQMSTKTNTFFYILLYVTLCPFYHAIILMGKRGLVALLNLYFWCLVTVEWLFLAVPWGCLQFVIVVFSNHTHLLFFLYHILLFYIILYWNCSIITSTGST